MSSGNPFAQFAAGGGGGWMTTKKRGRDDAQIAADKQKAIDANRARRGLKPRDQLAKERKKAKGSGAGGRSRKPARRRKDEDDDYDSSEEEDAWDSANEESDDEEDDMDGFIVGDDEEIEEEEGPSSSEEEESFMTHTGTTKRRSVPAPRRIRPNPASSSLPQSRRPSQAAASAMARGGRAVRKKRGKENNVVESDEDDDDALLSSSSDDSSSPRPKKRRGGATHKKKVADVVTLDDDDDDDEDDELDSPAFDRTERRTKTKTNPPRRSGGGSGGDCGEEKKAEDSDDHDDDSVEVLHTGTKKKTTVGSGVNSGDDGLKRKTSPYFGGGGSSQGKNVSVTASSQEKESEEDETSDQEFELEDTPPPKQKARKRVGGGVGGGGGGGGKRKSVLSDSDDDDDVRRAKEASLGAFSSSMRSSSTPTSAFDDDDFMDDDEATAVLYALEESVRDSRGRKRLGSNKHKKKDKSTNKKKKKNRVVVDIDDDDDGEEEASDKMFREEEDEEEEEDGDDDEVDAYVDEEEREAGSVLKAAQRLSADVIQTMMGWGSSSSSLSGKNGGNGASHGHGGSIPTGVIVDGALALSTVRGRQQPDGTNDDDDEDGAAKGKNDVAAAAGGGEGATTVDGDDEEAKNGRHRWISDDEMRAICPGLKLADYQLIGVNWLVLLHGMKCNVDGGGKSSGNKKKDGGMRVNGVLADEMGLGKTVQTIAFLAWLKHQSSGAAISVDDFDEEKRRSAPVEEDDDGNDRGDDDDDAEEVIEVDDDGVVCIDGNDENRTESRGGNAFCNRPHLIVVPASVLSNWERELEKFAPDLTVVKYHGTQAEREDIKGRLRKSLPYAKSHRTGSLPLDIVLTTFSYFSSEKSDDRSFLRKFNFDYMIVDEAHCLKNPKGMRYRNMDKFVTSHRLLLTGTPVQNSPKELMSLLCFLMPLFSQRPSVDDFDGEARNDGGARMLEHFVSLESQDGRIKGETSSENAYRKLKQLLAPFVLRRRKCEVLSQLMPPKTRKVELVPFDDATRTVYESILSSHVEARRNKSVLDATAQKHLFTSLRKAANHPLLLRTRHTDESSIRHLSRQLYQCGYFGRDATCTEKLVKKELEDFSDYDIHCAALELIDENPCRGGELSRYTLKEEDLFCSPKFSRLRVLLPELEAKGHRMLIFSQWTRCLDLLGCLMEATGMKFLRLDGQTAISERQKLIDKFNNDSSIPVFLLSTRAGGMGINLTAADVCVLHDLDFNPFNDIQAEDRCHRIGQKKPVTVIKMITENTVDADIYSMQERKAQMNAAIFSNEREASSRDSDSASNGKTTTSSKKGEAKEISSLLDSAMDRFLLSPTQPKKTEEKEHGQYI